MSGRGFSFQDIENFLKIDYAELMCSIFLYNFKVTKNLLDDANQLLKLRGPDQTHILENSPFTFVHNLLAITGRKTLQPFVEGNIVALYNGEIYNYRDFDSRFTSDGECLIPLYKKWGTEFVDHLDGEFVLCLFDFDRGIFFIASDPFRTKPLFYAIENDRLAISSYASPLKVLGLNSIKSIPCNSIITFDLKSLKQKERRTIFPFSLEQTVPSYDRFFEALEKSVDKRSYDPMVITMSSGYDCGTIAAAMHRLNKPYHVITFNNNGRENPGILSERQKKCPGKFHSIYWTSSEKNRYLKQVREQGKHDISPKILADPTAAVFASAFMMEAAKNQGYKVHLSGSGSDEIISDYWGGLLSGNFGGVFPEDLSTIFPRDPLDTKCKWQNFYEGAQSRNLFREEFIGGLYGIENRYPFLDKKLVQEFLSLRPSLKNKHYKAPLREYLTLCKYPFDKDKKIGLSS